MEVDEKPTEDYGDIGGLDKQVLHGYCLGGRAAAAPHTRNLPAPPRCWRRRRRAAGAGAAAAATAAACESLLPDHRGSPHLIGSTTDIP